MSNRIEETVDGVTTQYTYDDNDRLIQQGGTTYTYDAQGNTLSQSLDAQTTTYTYNAKNQLISQENEAGTTTYSYNLQGIRVSKQTPEEQTVYIVDSQQPYAQVIQEITDGSLAVSYTYGNDLISQTRGGVTHDYHYDGLGSARYLSDQNGTFTDSYDYQAFGKLLNTEGNTTNTYLYAGEQRDSESGHYYLRARYYAPTTGRFTQMDTYAGNNPDPVTLHKYLYANANPVDNIDPTGQYSMLSMTTSIAIRGILTGMQYGGYLQTISDIATGNFQFSALSILQEIILNQIRGSRALMRLAERRLKWLDDFIKRRKLPKQCFNSFDGATLVATEHGLVPIEEIEIGDKVWAYNEANQSKSLQEVVHLIRGEHYKELIDIELSSGEVIVTTDNHPFWAVDSSSWIEADTLTDSTVLRNIKDENVTIKSLKHHTEFRKVYNLTVDNYHSYFVGVGGVLGHNANWYDCIDDLPTWRGSTLRDLDSLHRVKPFYRGADINKISEIIRRKGGKIEDWSKVKGIDEFGQEWHWYQRKGVDRIYAKKRLGEMDPPWEDW